MTENNLKRLSDFFGLGDEVGVRTAVALTVAAITGHGFGRYRVVRTISTPLDLAQNAPRFKAPSMSSYSNCPSPFLPS